MRKLDATLRRQPRMREARAWRGALRRSRSDYAGAAVDLARAAALGLRTPMLLTWLGEARLQAGDPRGMMDLEAAVAAPCQAWNFAWLARAKVAFERTPQALPFFDQAIALDPGNGWYHAWRGEAKRLLGRPTGMLRDFDRALTLDHDGRHRGWIRTWRGLACLQQSRWRAAARDFDAALRLMPDYPLALNGRARARHRLGRLEAWLMDLDRAARLDEKYFQSLAARTQKEAAETLSDLVHLARMKPRWGLPRLWRGAFLCLLGQAAEAEHVLGLAAALAPRDPWTYAWRAQARLALGRAKDALRDLDRAVHIAPRLAVVRGWRAKASLALGEHQRALRDYGTAIRLDPRYAWVFCERGALRLLIGDAAGAAADLRKGLSLDGGNAGAIVDLSAACARLGQRAESRRHWARAAEMSPADAKARRVAWNASRSARAAS